MAVAAYQPLYNITEVAKVLKTNKNFVYEEIRKGKIPVLKMGSYKVRGTDLENYISKYPTEEKIEEEG